ncbi:hypothetical protein FI615_002679 [Enterococcus faecium]|nr:hypothetical protein [Enterococcus faecium]EMF0115777.1 hypothetical protein [Enterococcus hirae]
MAIHKDNIRLPITLTPNLQADIQQLKKKYQKSASKIGRIALELLIEQERAGFEIKQLKK